MGNFLLYFTPVLSAFMGWGFFSLLISSFFQTSPQVFPSFTLKVILFTRKELFCQIIHTNIQSHTFTSKAIQEIATSKGFEQLRPFIDTHIDHFLRVKLKEQMPVIGSLIGERTIGQLKEIFVNELEGLFPEIMERYLYTLKENLDLLPLINSIADKLISPQTIATARSHFRAELITFKWWGAGIGFIMGLVQLGLILISTFYP